MSKNHKAKSNALRIRLRQCRPREHLSASHKAREHFYPPFFPTDHKALCELRNKLCCTLQTISEVFKKKKSCVKRCILLLLGNLLEFTNDSQQTMKISKTNLSAAILWTYNKYYCTVGNTKKK